MLEVWQNGKRVRKGLIPWDKYVEIVRAQPPPKPKREGRAGPNAGNFACLQAMPPERRCQFKHMRGPKAGSQCGAWAVKGATRCNKHGGIRQNPHHPAARAAIAEIERRNAGNLARRQAHKEFPAEIISTVRDTLTPKGGRWDWPAILQGCHAITQDDGGKAWRRFLEQRTAPSTEPKPERRRK